MQKEHESGTQYVLQYGNYEAVVASIGASLRVLTHDGRNLVVPFAADEERPAYRGALLAPWPNRVVGARYVFEGVEYELPVNEPERGHALHGLVAWADFRVTNQTPDSVTLETTIEPQPGYPWEVQVTTTYTLAANGLTQQVRLTNCSDSPVPVGIGTHPYLVAGSDSVAGWTLTIPANRVLLTDPNSLAPRELLEVPPQLDFRSARFVDQTRLDHAYTELVVDDLGRAEVVIVSEQGTGVVMTWGEDCAWVQLYTPDLSLDSGVLAGLAVEPMTCAPDAFNDDIYDFDTGLTLLEPGAAQEASWRIAALPRSDS